MAERKIQVFPNPRALAVEAARRVIELADEAIALQESFSIVLGGHGSIRPVLELLATPAYASQTDWRQWHVYFGEERCAPPDDPASNYAMARAALLGQVPVPEGQVYRMKGEGDPQSAAIDYGRLLKADFVDDGPDLVLLGMGADGHTASLFPGTEATREEHHRCVANWVPQHNAWRIAATPVFFNTARQVLVLVSGKDKAPVVQAVLEGVPDPDRYPVERIDPTGGKLVWLLDAEAAGMADDDGDR